MCERMFFYVCAMCMRGRGCEWVPVCGLCDAASRSTQGEFVRRVSFVRERLLQREQEITGEWLTEERMKTKHSWSK